MFDRRKEFSKQKEIKQESPARFTELNRFIRSLTEKLNEILMKYNRETIRFLKYYTPEEIMKKSTGLDSMIPISSFMITNFLILIDNSGYQSK